ncbi:hypothetical protein [Poriferisphaera sp. WC338]|uniref:hypothetical protein n=1 Tax=Poriferisphaera sp. WC338 TaxID=3425129 RepID=UPI003D81A298
MGITGRKAAYIDMLIIGSICCGLVYGIFWLVFRLAAESMALSHWMLILFLISLTIMSGLIVMQVKMRSRESVVFHWPMYEVLYRTLFLYLTISVVLLVGYQLELVFTEMSAGDFGKLVVLMGVIAAMTGMIMYGYDLHAGKERGANGWDIDSAFRAHTLDAVLYDLRQLRSRHEDSRLADLADRVGQLDDELKQTTGLGVVNTGNLHVKTSYRKEKQFYAQICELQALVEQLAKQMGNERQVEKTVKTLNEKLSKLETAMSAIQTA